MFLERQMFWETADQKQKPNPIHRILSHSEGDQPWDFFGRNDAKAYFGHLMRRVDSLEKTLMLGGIGGRRRRGRHFDSMGFGWPHL